MRPMLSVTVLLLSLVFPQVTHATTTIDADRMEAQQADNSARFSGKVELIMDALHLQSDTLVAHYGDHLGGAISRAEASGNVRLQREQVRGKADAATLDRTRDLIILSGNAELDEPGHQVRGDRIEHHLSNGNTKVLRSKHGKRVHIHIDDDHDLNHP
ncbi:MAG: LptA/OstA family protein [Mariprofundales bacterium]